MVSNILFIISFYFLIVDIEGTGELSFQTYTILENSDIRYVENLISSFTTLSTLRCGSFCDLDTNCVALGYNQIEKTCELYNSITSDSGTSLSSTGWVMYLTAASLCTGELLSNETYPVRFISTKAKREDAFKLCEDAGQKLVKIDTTDKMDFILKVISQCSSYQDLDFWIDGSNMNATDFLADDAWTFSDGSAMPMTADLWCKDKPDNADTEHCVRLHSNCDHLFNDKHCTDKYGYICEP